MRIDTQTRAMRLTSVGDAPVGSASSALVLGRPPSATAVSKIFRSTAIRAATVRVACVPPPWSAWSSSRRRVTRARTSAQMFHRSDSTGVSAAFTSSCALLISLSRASSSPSKNLPPSVATLRKACSMLSF